MFRYCLTHGAEGPAIYLAQPEGLVDTIADRAEGSAIYLAQPEGLGKRYN